MRKIEDKIIKKFKTNLLENRDLTTLEGYNAFSEELSEKVMTRFENLDRFIKKSYERAYKIFGA